MKHRSNHYFLGNANSFTSQKIAKEYLAFQAMVRIYCRKIHGGQGLFCESCQELLDYAEKRLRHCHYIENKPRCQDCKTPCFAPGQKNLIKEIMKFSGPRLIFHHPFLAVRHSWNKFKFSTSPQKNKNP